MNEDLTAESLSIAMALQNLEDVVEEAAELKRQYEAKLAERDRLVLEAGDYPVTRLARVARLSRERIYQIRAAAALYDD